MKVQQCAAACGGASSRSSDVEVLRLVAGLDGASEGEEGAKHADADAESLREFARSGQPEQ